MILPRRAAWRLAAQVFAASILAGAAPVAGPANDTQQPPPVSGPVNPWREVVRDLADRLSSTLRRGEPFDLTTTLADAPRGTGVRAIEADLAARLRTRGLRAVAASETNAHVTVTCARNPRDLLCAAEIVRANDHQVLLASRPRAPDAAATERPSASLVLRPVITQARRLFDLTVLDEQRMLALDDSGLTLYERQGDGWAARAAVKIDSPGPLPRDARGRLIVRSGAVEAFLPGSACRGTLEPLAVTCMHAQEPWPLGLENGGVTAGSNSFTSPRTPDFLAAARVADEPGSEWLVLGTDGHLRLLTPTSPATVPFEPAASDMASLTAGCGLGRLALIATSDPAGDGEPDSLVACQLVGRQLVRVTSPVTLPGTLVAIWPSDDASQVLVVCHNDDADRYEAFLVGLACVR